ncbi:MAG TPA: prolyl oligopeptidase family serine peptidase [Pirellulaceae bacterium]|nr:prolyl oligopeptidase family serine peptidase [Pirellulaceae bacterium]
MIRDLKLNPVRSAIIVWVICGVSVDLSTAQTFQYPDTRRVEQRDDYFGTIVADPYRWLETDVRESDDVRQWVEAQNEVSFGYIKALPHRDAIERRLTQLWDFEKYGAPSREGQHYYFAKNDGLQNQFVIYQQDSLDGPARVFLDPNAWSEDGTVALAGLSFSDDGKYAAYGVAEAGSDWTTWRILDTDSLTPLDDEIRWTKFSSIAWAPDGSGFYYSRFDEPQAGEEFQGLNLNQKVFFHSLRSSQSDDVLVHADPDHPEWGFTANVTDDGRFLVLTTWKGTDDRYRILYRDLSVPESDMTVLIDNFDHEYTLVGNEGSWLYFQSDVNAPNKCVLAIDVNQSDPGQWRVIVPQAEETLDSSSMVGDLIFAQYLKDAVTLVRVYDLNGNHLRDVEFPGLGTASGFGGKRGDAETFYSFSSFNRPPSIYRYDLRTGTSKLLREAQVRFHPDDYEVHQVFYTSRDGTRVPMFIAHKRGIELNGRNPTLLYGYGGFNISLTPGFSVSRLQWMEMGGVFAMPNLRGGGEYGKEWHQAGTKLRKQNVFDDFISAAQWLIDNGYTSPAHLGIQGGSNGGLLVGACMTQRPDLFGACLPAVGVMDMLRFQKFTAGRYWVDDYGSSEASAEEFQALFAYSPYHNLRDGVAYPATLVTTADTDDRVVPGHSFKFAARLQAAHAGSQPVLIRIETRAGHGAGKPTAKVIEETADQWAFLVKHLGLQPTIPEE